MKTLTNKMYEQTSIEEELEKLIQATQRMELEVSLLRNIQKE